MRMVFLLDIIGNKKVSANSDFALDERRKRQLDVATSRQSSKMDLPRLTSAARICLGALVKLGRPVQTLQGLASF